MRDPYFYDILCLPVSINLLVWIFIHSRVYLFHYLPLVFRHSSWSSIFARIPYFFLLFFAPLTSRRKKIRHPPCSHPPRSSCAASSRPGRRILSEPINFLSNFGCPCDRSSWGQHRGGSWKWILSASLLSILNIFALVGEIFIVFWPGANRLRR